MRNRSRIGRIAKTATRDFKNNWAFAVVVFVALGLGAVCIVQSLDTTPRSMPVILIWSIVIAFSLFVVIAKFVRLLVGTSRKSVALQNALELDEESSHLQQKLLDLDQQFNKMEIEYQQTETALLARQNKVKKNFVYKKGRTSKASLKGV